MCCEILRGEFSVRVDELEKRKNLYELKFAKAFCYFLAIQKVGREEK